ncbi:MAG: Alkaline phosphatase synthesis transcriptional regulatory protein PhoP [Candidatus Parcubacteria bacterium]|jgi:DNA-binding response OmpR family regulator
MPEQNKKSILLIEDDIFLRELVSIKLKDAKYNVIEASDGAEGLKKMLSENYEVVLLDIMLPFKTGFEVLEQFNIKKNKDFNPKIIILSNLNDQNKIKNCLKLGAVDYIIKAHYSPTEIVSKINDLIKK